MGAYATAFPGGVADHARIGRRARRAVRLPGRRPTRAHRRGDGRGRRRAASSTSSTRPAATSSRCCPTPSSSTTRSAACRCACTRTSSCRARCSSTRARSSCCCPRPPATSSAAAAPRPPPSGGSRSAPRSPGPRSGEARSEWEIFVDLARHVDPDRARPRRVRVGPGDPRRDRRVVPLVRGRRAAARDRRRGAVGRHAALRRRELPDARRQGALHRGRARRAPTCPTGSFVLSTRRGQAVQLDGARSERDPLTGAMRDALFMAPTDAARSGSPTATASSCARTTARCTARVHVRRAPPRQRPGVLPRGQRAAPRAVGATRRRACPTTTRSSPSSRRR